MRAPTGGPTGSPAGSATRGGPLAFFGGALRGIADMARSASRAAVFVALVAAASAAVSVPAWLLASRLPRLFTALTAALLAGFVLLLAALRLRRAARAAGGVLPWVRERLLPAAGDVLAVLVFLAAGYAIAVLFASGLTGAAAPAAAVYLVLLGRRIYSARRRTRAEGAPPEIRGAGNDSHP